MNKRILVAWAAISACAQTPPMAPPVLPGKGLSQHDFFYAGEQKQQWMFIVRKGRIEWSYINPNGRGEISDAVLLSNGNVVFAHQYGVTVINHDKKVLWNYDAPAGAETHTARPIGKDLVLFIQNGDPAFVRVVNIRTNETVREFRLSVRNPKSVHGQFRAARLTDAGTLLVSHMDGRTVSEIDSNGAEIASFSIDSPWSATRLPNGNTLAVSNRKVVREFDGKGNTVWELTADDLPGYRISGFQTATRLPNGNTLVNNWFNQWSATLDAGDQPVQAIEVTPDKKIVWALRSWKDPVNLGPSTIIQLLDERSVPENVHWGDIR
jgi:hypothetical protein